MIEALGGIVWQKTPSVHRNDIIKDGAAWYVTGEERVEIDGTDGWRHTVRSLYLQEGGVWNLIAHYFPTQEVAQKALEEAVKDVKSPGANEISAFELAFREAEAKKKRRRK